MNEYFNTSGFAAFKSETDSDNDLGVVIDDLIERLTALESEENPENVSVDKQDSIRSIVTDKIQDIVWNDFFYVSEMDPAGSALTAGQATSNSESNEQASMSIKKQSRFRCVFNLLAYNTGGTAYITTNHIRPVNVGYSIGDNDGEWSGFKIDSNGLTAMNFKLGSVSEVLVESLLATGDDIILEIRFFPKDRADFYVNYALVASISSDLPNDSSLEIYALHFSEVLTGGSTLDIQRIEFLQSNK